jgi:uncharacterized protein (TIGR00255 family)
MTGFGEASAQVNGVHYFLEIRALNSKYLKAVIRLPEEFQGLEAEIESELRRLVTRGTVTVSATCTDASESAAYGINHRALERYIEQIRKLPMIASGEVSFDAASLLTLPGVLQPPANEEARLEATRAVFLDLLARAIKSMTVMRQTEGRSLLDELSRQRDLMADRLALVAARAPSVAEEYARRLKARIEQMLQQAELKVEPVEMIKEIAVYAERTDINEEISRLKGHIEQYSELIGTQDPKPVGRTLDFLTQEMLREANTIASKSPDSQVSRAIIEVKGAIDRIKELVQNVE